MIHLGLLGWPVSHSLSPKLHNAALKAMGLEGEYSLYPVEPGNDLLLENLLSKVRVGELRGLNVTIPYKQAVIPLLDRLSLSAKSIGAVNTIFLENGLLVGHNTDAPGFRMDLKKFSGNAFTRRSGGALILGAGGSARAVLYSLTDSFKNIVVAARKLDQAQNLIDSFRNAGDEVFIEAVEMTSGLSRLNLDGIDLIVNTTPVGMHPNVEFSPWPVDLELPHSCVVYDLIYNPRETLLVRRAREMGFLATTGLGMLVEQAALGFEIWTGLTPPREAMFSSLEEE